MKNNKLITDEMIEEVSEQIVNQISDLLIEEDLVNGYDLNHSINLYINIANNLILQFAEEQRDKLVAKTISLIKAWMDKHEEADSSFSTDKLLGHLMRELL